MQTMGFIKSDFKIIDSSILVPYTFTHSIAFGQTGSGKTTSFIYPNLQDRIERGDGILLYDYKGKEHLSVKYFADKASRLDDVVEIAKPWGEYINIIQQMSEEDFDSFFDNILHHGDDNKFWQNSAKSLGQSVLKILKDISQFSQKMSVMEFNESYIKAGGFYYPTDYTLTALIKVCQSFEKLSKFIENLDSLLSKTYEIIQESIKEDIKKHKDIDALKPQYAEVIRAREHLIETVKQTTDSLEGLGKESNENLTQNIIGSLIAPLISLSQNSFFNKNSFDIAKALDEGKIVIVNSEALSDAALESFNNTILNQLTIRTRNIHNSAISIFIDEAQRVLSADTDLPIDVLREAKVDVFLAVQNSALLKNRLGEERYEALIGNLTQQFYFKNSDKEDLVSDYDLNTLEPFEYLSSEDDFKKPQYSQALHVSLKEKLQIEYKYQKRADILKNFAYNSRDKEIILEYDSKLYKNGEFISIDIHTLAQSTVLHESELSLEHINSEINHLIKSAIEEINLDTTHEFEYEYFDDDIFEEAS